jgi:hypothetical protein
MTWLEILKWGAELVKAVVDGISEAAKGPEPPTLAQLAANAKAFIDARTQQGDWTAAVAKEGAAKFIETAADPASADDDP